MVVVEPTVKYEHICQLPLAEDGLMLTAISPASGLVWGKWLRLLIA